MWNAFEVKYVQRIFDLLSWEKFHRGVSTSPKKPLGTSLLLAIESSGYGDAVRSRRKYTLSEKSNNSHLPIFRNSKASVFTREFEEIFQVWNFEEVLSSAEAVI